MASVASKKITLVIAVWQCALLCIASAGHVVIESYENKDCSGEPERRREGTVISGMCAENTDPDENFDLSYRRVTCNADGSTIAVEYFSDQNCNTKVDYDAVLRKQISHDLSISPALIQ